MKTIFKNILKRIKYFFKWLYHKLARINDSPQKIAQGIALGVFLGIFPGAGPIAALVLSSLFRMNRAAALLGSLLTNTWISIVTFFLAVKVGSIITGVDKESISSNWSHLTANFHWVDLFKVGVLEVIFPVMAGYITVSFVIAFFTYLVALVAVKQIEKRRCLPQQ